jgi:cytidine deaminase
MHKPGNADLAAQALDAAGNAWCPYSGLSVGAALLDDGGKVYCGCNVENASYPEGCCAETAAIAAMILGGGRRIDTIAVAGWRAGPEACTPCGGCRQRIAEFADANTRVLVVSGRETWDERTAAELLPESFRLGP